VCVCVCVLYDPLSVCVVCVCVNPFRPSFTVHKQRVLVGDKTPASRHLQAPRFVCV